MRIRRQKFVTKKEKDKRRALVMSMGYGNPPLVAWPKGRAIYTVFYWLYGKYPRLRDMPEIQKLNATFNRI